MRELKLDTRSCLDEQGTLHIFHYFVLIELSDLFGSCTEQYGIRITEEHGDTASIANITSDSTRIHTLLTLLSEHCVGPTGLADVVADWL